MTSDANRGSALPAGVEPLDEAFVAALVPERPERGHKGTFGSLLAVAGSLEYAGAALLAGSAALRSGAGLVTLCLPASLQPVLAGRVPELITLGLPETVPGEPDAAAAADLVMGRAHQALLVGPGLRPGPATVDLVTALQRAETGPAVLDAEALNSLAGTPEWWLGVAGPRVLTPHPGEFARLGARPADDDEARAAACRAAAERWSQVVVLKGAGTVIAEPGGRTRLAPFREPALATGGTGDVLAGIIASLLCQGLEPFEAACLGVFLHGSAARNVRERLGDAGLVASDLLPELPRVRRHLGALRDRARMGRRLGFVARDTDA